MQPYDGTKKPYILCTAWHWAVRPYHLPKSRMFTAKAVHLATLVSHPNFHTLSTIAKPQFIRTYKNGKEKKRIGGRRAPEWSWDMMCTSQSGGISKVERPIYRNTTNRLEPPNIPWHSTGGCETRADSWLEEPKQAAFYKWERIQKDLVWRHPMSGMLHIPFVGIDMFRHIIGVARPPLLEGCF